MENRSTAVLADGIIYGVDHHGRTEVIRLDDIWRMQTSEDLEIYGQKATSVRVLNILRKDGSMARIQVLDPDDWAQLIRRITKADPDLFISSYHGGRMENFQYCYFNRVSHIWKIKLDSHPKYNPDIAEANVITWFPCPGVPYESMKFGYAYFKLIDAETFHYVIRLAERAEEESPVLCREETCSPDTLRYLEKLEKEAAENAKKRKGARN